MKRIARLIRSLTPIPLRNLIQEGGNFFGRGLTYFPSMEGSFKILRQLGLAPCFCVDIGAYQGEWARLFKSEFPGAKVLMIEAQEAKRRFLEQTVAQFGDEVQFEICLLGPADGQIVQFTEMETGSSVFAEASPYARKTVEETTCTLDAILAKGNYPPVDFLKLDVQGYELEILKGSSRSLAQASAVLLEASLVPINAGCPLIAEVMAFMDKAGFRLLDFCSQIRRQDGVLWQTDLLFLRSSSPTIPKPTLP